MGVGALAAVTVMGAGLVDLPMTTAETGPAQATGARTTRVENLDRPIRYVRLERGEKAPKGARVIEEAAPKPRVVVRRIVTPAPSQGRRTVIRTRQSGG